ncbi:hypothetical protein [Streptomyces sp. NPDC018045]|uniref:hypothetical protein n=1 Tax=Streptomyces sp. NPDC018045 TaxID=3365037 RepID=UPI00379075D1
MAIDEDEDDELPCLIDCDECGKIMEPGLFDGDDPLLTVLPDSSETVSGPDMTSRVSYRCRSGA